MAALFEPLFLDASVLSVDNRLFPPLTHHITGEDSTRPMNVLTTDINGFFVPQTLVSLEQLAEGHIPLWDDRQLLGQPLFASLGFTPFYPTAILFAFLDPLRAFAVTIALHLFLLGFGTWRFFCSRGLAFFPAMLGATSVMFCGFVANHWHMTCFLMAYAWLPWLLLGGDKLLARLTSRDRRRGRRAAAGLGLIIGLCLLTGGPQISALVILLAAVAFAASWLANLADLSWRPLMPGLAAGCVGALLSGILILPSAELYSVSARAELTAHDGLHKHNHLDPPALVGFALPRFFGNPVQDISMKEYDGRRLETFPSMRAWLSLDAENNVVESTTWFGGLAFVLAILAFLHAPRSGYRFPAAVFVLTLGTALGIPILADVFRGLPGVGVGSHKRVLCLTMFAGAWLAANTLQRYGAGDRSHSRGGIFIVPGLVMLALAGVGFFPFESSLFPDAEASDQGWFRAMIVGDLVLIAVAGAALLVAALLLRKKLPAIATAVLTIVVAAEGLHVSRAMNPPQPLANQYAPTPVIEWLRERGAADSSRIVSFDATEALPGCMAQVLGLRSCNGYLPLPNREVHELYSRLEPGMVRDAARTYGAVMEVDNLASPLLDLLGARYVVTSINGYLRLGESLPHGLERVYVNERERIAVYERPNALPPAFLVPRVSHVADRDTRLTILTSDDFVPAKRALVEDAGPAGEDLGTGSADYTRIAPDRIRVKVACNKDAFLVVTETWFDGWHATIDGATAKLHRANHALMGIAVPAGDHEVELRYRPTSFTVGAVMSGLGLLACLLLFVLPARPGAAQDQGEQREQA